MKRWMIVCASLPLVFACSGQGSGSGAAPPPDASAPGFLGALRSEGRMLTTDDRCTFSFLFDRVYKERIAAADQPKSGTDAKPPAPQGDPPKTGPDAPTTWTFVMNAPDKLAGASLRIFIRGGFHGAVGPIGAVKMEYGGVTQATQMTAKPLPPAPGQIDANGEGFELELDGVVTKGENEIKLTLVLDPPGNADVGQRLEIDSLDLGAEGASCPPLKADWPPPPQT